MLNPQSLTALWMIAAIVALGPLSTDLYLPALPRLTEALNTSVDQVQITLSIFFVGFALAQLVYGPLADRFGRKPIMLLGLGLFVLASLGCATAESIESLIAFRLLQSLGACCGPVLGRTMVRDIYGPVEAARAMSMMGSVMALAPAVAPIIGGYLIVHYDWPSAFQALAVYGVAGLVILGLLIPETLKPEYRASLKPLDILRNYGQLIRNPVFIGFSLCCAFSFAGLFAFLSGSSFVLIGHFGVPPEQFGYYFTVVVAGYITGAQLGRRWSHKTSPHRLIVISGLIGACGGAAMALASLLGWHSLYWVIGCQFVFMASVGVVMPQAMAQAIAPFPQMTGTASSLLGFMQSLIAAGVGIMVGRLHTGTPLVMACAIALSAIAALLGYWLLAYQRQPSLTPAAR